MIKHRIGKPYVRRLKQGDIPATTQAKSAIDYLNNPDNHLKEAKAYAVCLRCLPEVFHVSLSKRQLIKLMNAAIL
ncbi:hypothetical protein, partial [Providencia sp. PROV110]|uniref:hypothetical protein n=1 Tax=Providencia sp. PROV110 TaxID=2949821 RepID=UPI00234A2EBC